MKELAMPTGILKELTPKERNRLSWAQRLAYDAQHGPRPSNEFAAFTELKQAVSGMLAAATAFAIQFGGMCGCTESTAWGGKAMTAATNAGERIRLAVTPAEMVKAVQDYAKEIAADKTDNHAANAIEGAIKEAVAFAETQAKALPKQIAAPELETRGGRGRAVPTGGTQAPIGGGKAKDEPPEKDDPPKK